MRLLLALITVLALIAAGLLFVMAEPAHAQQCGVFKTWTASEVLTSSDLNSSFQRTVDANSPVCVDDYSSTITQMQTVTNPFPGGAESLPTKLSGELERIRYQLKAIIGGAQWYSPPANNLSGSSYLQLTEIADPAAGAANTARIYAKDNGSGTTILAYKDSAGVVRPILTSDISSTVASLTMPVVAPPATPPAGNLTLWAGGGSALIPAYVYYKTADGNTHVLAVAEEQRWTTLAGLEMKRESTRVLRLTVDRLSLQGYPLFSVNNTVDLNTTGAGGRGCEGAVCDPLVANSFYYIWMMYNGVSTARYMVATSDLAPYTTGTKKPPGTTSIRLVGAWRTDASSNFYDGVQRDNVFNYTNPRQVTGPGAGGTFGVGSGTFVAEAPVTVSRANILVTADIPDAGGGIPSVAGMWAFRAHNTTITGGLASTAVSYPVVAATNQVGTIRLTSTLFSGATSAPVSFNYEVDLIPAKVYVTGWELQTRDP